MKKLHVGVPDSFEEVAQWCVENRLPFLIFQYRDILWGSKRLHRELGPPIRFDTFEPDSDFPAYFIIRESDYIVFSMRFTVRFCSEEIKWMY